MLKLSAIAEEIEWAINDLKEALIELKKVIDSAESAKEKKEELPLQPQEEIKIKTTTTTRAGADERVGGRARTRTKFIPPSQEEVLAYLMSRNSPVDAVQFWNYYESNGWKVGRNKMKNWHSAVVTWERKERERKIEKWRNSNTVLAATTEQLSEAKGAIG